VNTTRPLHSEPVYRRRLLASLAVVLGGLLLLVELWPAPSSTSPSLARYSDRPSDRIQLEEVTPTSQSQELRPPPPAPLPPVVVPNDRLIETDFEFSDGPLPIEDPDDDARRQAGTASTPTASRLPDTGARLLRAVQPTYPDAARREDVRARVRIAVQVDERGEVTSASIVERWRLSGDGTATPAAELGYGLEDAALAAARRSRFRPARADGAPVPTRTTITFTFGE
jgi:outer membrane biosynthesis protein TonB